MRKFSKVMNIISILLLIANMSLFLSTAIQVGFAHNLNVPTVPKDITMNSTEANALPGLAARGWAAGTCILFIIIGILGITGKIERRTSHNIFWMADYLTLLPIILIFFTSKLPEGASWIFMHHVIIGTLILITRPKK